MIKLFLSQFSNLRMLIKYGISGSIAVLVQIGVLVLLVEYFEIDHIPAVAIAFIISAFVAFSFQKFWTFRDHSLDQSHFQVVSYLILALIAFFLTMFIMYIFIEVIGVWYVVAQIFTTCFVAVITFLTNKNFIFNRDSMIFQEKENKQ